MLEWLLRLSLLSVQVSLPTQYNEGGQKPVGALSELLAKLKDGATPNLQLTEGMKEALNALPATPQYAIPTKVNELGQNVLTGTNNTNFFSGLGFDYIGPIDGHNVEELVSLFEGEYDLMSPSGHVGEFVLGMVIGADCVLKG